MYKSCLLSMRWEECCPGCCQGERRRQKGCLSDLWPDWLTNPESIELFVEDQAFSPSYDWVLPHLLPPPFSKLSLFLSLHVSIGEITDRKGGREGGGANSYDREKAWSSINHSILSGQPVRCKKCLQRCKNVCMNKHTGQLLLPGGITTEYSLFSKRPISSFYI